MDITRVIDTVNHTETTIILLVCSSRQEMPPVQQARRLQNRKSHTPPKWGNKGLSRILTCCHHIAAYRKSRLCTDLDVCLEFAGSHYRPDDGDEGA
jgi:hypothetical protein